MIVEKAAKHCSDRWFPANTELLRELKRRIGDGIYTNNRTQLIFDLKEDLGSYSLVIKNAANYHDILSASNPLKWFETSSEGQIVELIEELLQNDTKPLSSISVYDTSALVYSLISSSVAETLASRRDLNEEEVFLASILRNLSSILTVFNYPSIAEKFLLDLEHDKQLAFESIKSRLGFSPDELTNHYLQAWHVSEELKGLIREPKYDIFELSEKFAAKVVEDCNHSGRVDLDKFSPQLRELGLKSRDIERLSNNLDRRILGYKRILPSFFGHKTSGERNSGIVAANPALSKLNEEAQEIFNDAYLNFSQHNRLKSMSILTRSVVPRVGFTRGALFIRQDDSELLVPKLFLGMEDPEMMTKLYSPFSMLRPPACALPLLISMSYKEPNLEKNQELFGRTNLDYITWRFADNANGLFVLEIANSHRSLLKRTLILRYQAVRIALIHFLKS